MNFRGFILTSVLITLGSTSALAKKTDLDKDVLYYADDFTVHTERFSKNLRQVATGYNLSCGPTSALVVYNYHNVRLNGVPAGFSSSVESAKGAIQRVYSSIGNGQVNVETSTDQIKQMALARWSGWTAKKASGSNSFNTNIANMKDWLLKDQPVIVALEPSMSPVRGYAHLVVVYAFSDHKTDQNKDSIWYYDPYYGKYHKIFRPDFAKAIQGNLPYLRISPP